MHYALQIMGPGAVKHSIFGTLVFGPHRRERIAKQSLGEASRAFALAQQSRARVHHAGLGRSKALQADEENLEMEELKIGFGPQGTSTQC